MKNESSRVLGLLLGVAVALGSIVPSGHADAQDRSSKGRLAPQRTAMSARDAPASESRGAMGAISQKRTGALDRREPNKPAQVKRLEPASTRAPVDKLQHTRASKTRARR